MIEFISFNPRNAGSQYDNPHFLDNEMKSRKESSGASRREGSVFLKEIGERNWFGINIILSSALDMFALFCFQLF